MAMEKRIFECKESARAFVMQAAVPGRSTAESTLLL